MLSAYFEAHGGGVEVVAGALARGLASRGLAVTWMAASGDATPAGSGRLAIRPMSAWNGIERCTGIPFPLWRPSALRELRRTIATCDLLIVQDTLYVPHLCAMARARGMGKPIILIQHIGDVPYRNPFAHSLVRLGNATATRWAMGGADRVVFISRAVRSWFERRQSGLAAKAVYIPNGVDTLNFAAPSVAERDGLRRDLELGSNPVALFVGRFVAKKGIGLMRRLAAHFPECTFIFAGSGPIDPTSGGHGNVRVLGHISARELGRWYRSADVLLLPSYGEGFPLVVQEALTCGLPALVSEEVATACPELADALRGLPVTGAESDFVHWSLELTHCLHNPLHSATRATFATRASGLWSWDQTLDQYTDVIEQVAARRAADCVR